MQSRKLSKKQWIGLLLILSVVVYCSVVGSMIILREGRPTKSQIEIINQSRAEVPILLATVKDCNLYFYQQRQELQFRFPSMIGCDYKLWVQPNPETNIFFNVATITNCVNTNGLFVVDLKGANLEFFRQFYIQKVERK